MSATTIIWLFCSGNPILRKLHLTVGLIGVVGFLLTGVYLRRHTPPMDELEPLTRLLLRSRHVYLLLSSLLNLGVGSYFVWSASLSRRAAQSVGSALILVAPCLVTAAFFLEADRGNFVGRLALVAMVFMLVGTLLGFAATLRAGSR